MYNCYYLILEFLLQIKRWCEEYTQGLYCIWLGRTPFIVIYKPEFAEVIE